MAASYQTTLRRLFELQKFGIKLGLSSTANLLSRLGDPHLGLPCLHVAGTNGKGSTAAMVEAALLAAGIKTGLYTSPHLVSFTERFRVAGRQISRSRVVDLARRAWRAVDQREPPTFFEIVTAMAFLHFAETGVELAIVECGLGGRLDATNLCRPLVTLITNLGMEHQEHLGHSLHAIAYEKAGIIKPKVPLLHGVAAGIGRQVVEARAVELGAPVWRRGRELRLRRRADGGFSLWGPFWTLKGLASPLPGKHQMANALMAFGCCQALSAAGLAVTADHFQAGLARVDWPGRLERWPPEPGQPAIWLDGAHNPAAARTLSASLPALRGPGPLVMVIGIMGDKDLGPMLAALMPPADHVVLSRPAYSRAAEPQELAAFVPPDAPPFEIIGDLAAALTRARRRAGRRGTVVVSGSLFTVGETRAILGGRRPDPLA